MLSLLPGKMFFPVICRFPLRQHWQYQLLGPTLSQWVMERKGLQNRFNSIITHPIALEEGPTILEYTKPCIIPQQNQYSLGKEWGKRVVVCLSNRKYLSQEKWPSTRLPVKLKEDFLKWGSPVLTVYAVVPEVDLRPSEKTLGFTGQSPCLHITMHIVNF